MNIIKISNLTKHYRIYPTPWMRLKDAVGLPTQYKDFNALDNISLEIKKGEFWGVLGKNGSGKSTLLKIVAGHLQPTSGQISTSGKVTLLQLGLGFDPELSGLENIKYSRILQNLNSDFEEIEAFVKEFSELGDFINYPVKTYSSGMYSRLAFATAIAGDPDILIADEVLAVGDMNFSQKCLGKMREFKERGKTIVLVTHDVNQVKAFCDKAILINDGQMMKIGLAKTVAEDFRNFMLYGTLSDLSSEVVSSDLENQAYIRVAGASTNKKWIQPNPERRTVNNRQVEIVEYRYFDIHSSEQIDVWIPGATIELQIKYRVLRSCVIHSFGFTLNDRNGMIALHLNTEFFGNTPIKLSNGKVQIAALRFEVPPLCTGDYSVSIAFFEGGGLNISEKYDFDSSVSIEWNKSPITDRQGGYVIVANGSASFNNYE